MRGADQSAAQLVRACLIASLRLVESLPARALHVEVRRDCVAAIRRRFLPHGRLPRLRGP